MTAEIIVFNREGIAMAADSAVTSNVGDIDKISSSANKLFALSDRHPVGIMIYGNSSFMGIPWETIIKIYRSTALPQCGFPTLNEYANNFTSFLCYKNIRFHQTAEGNYIWSFVSDIIEEIKGIIIKKLEYRSDKGEDIDVKGLSLLTKKVIDEAYNFHHKLDYEYIPMDHSKMVLKKYDQEIRNYINRVFYGFPLNKEYRLKLEHILIEAFSKYIPDNVSSGVVFAGFGEEEVLPAVKALKIEGIVKLQQEDNFELLKYREDDEKSSPPDAEAVVISYAQDDMVYRFMEGVDPDYITTGEQFLNGLCKDYAQKVVSQLDRYSSQEKKKIIQALSRYGRRMASEYSTNMREFAKLYFTDPTVDAVGRLTKSELASMAEALVYITSLKRKVSSESETVAEPIDVALISKGDGFIWIKRKHYFEPKLNPIYFMRRNKEVNNECFENTKQSDSPTE